MSTNFEVLPTRKKKIECSELINSSMDLFNRFLEKENINTKLEITVKEVVNDKIDFTPRYLISEESKYTLLEVDKQGELYIFFNRTSEMDKDFWKKEIECNIKAKNLQKKIECNLETGFSWIIKRTMSQPPIVSLYQGCLAIAIAKMTDGVIYSDDGGWDYSLLPMDHMEFEKSYFDMGNQSKKEEICGWLSVIKGDASIR